MVCVKTVDGRTMMYTPPNGVACVSQEDIIAQLKERKFLALDTEYKLLYMGKEFPKHMDMTTLAHAACVHVIVK